MHTLPEVEHIDGKLGWIVKGSVHHQSNQTWCNFLSKLSISIYAESLLVGYSDASFGTVNEIKSQSEVLFTLHGSWQHRTSQSTTEAKLIALQLAANECKWLQSLIQEWNIQLNGPITITSRKPDYQSTTINEDIQQVIKLINGTSKRYKYLAIGT